MVLARFQDSNKKGKKNQWQGDEGLGRQGEERESIAAARGSATGLQSLQTLFLLLARELYPKKSHVDGERGLQGEEQAGFCDLDHAAWELRAVTANHPSHKD